MTFQLGTQENKFQKVCCEVSSLTIISQFQRISILLNTNTQLFNYVTMSMNDSVDLQVKFCDIFLGNFRIDKRH